LKNKRKSFIAAVLVILPPVLFGCQQEIEKEEETENASVISPSLNEISSTPIKLSVGYSSEGYDDVYKYGWYQEDNDNLYFTWVFGKDGTISITHCCGLQFPTYNYLLCGNVFITYGLGDKAPIDASNYTVTETSDKVTLTRKADGLRLSRADKIEDEKAEDHSHHNVTNNDSPLAIISALLEVSQGKDAVWQGADGTKYKFSPSAELTITSPSGDTEQYKYLLRYNELITLGPLVNGQEAGIRQFWLSNNGKLILRRADGTKIELSRFN